jgi:hypothetical protein
MSTWNRPHAKIPPACAFKGVIAYELLTGRTPYEVPRPSYSSRIVTHPFRRCLRQCRLGSVTSFTR